MQLKLVSLGLIDTALFVSSSVSASDTVKGLDIVAHNGGTRAPEDTGVDYDVLDNPQYSCS
jgi:hypothetical protein